MHTTVLAFLISFKYFSIQRTTDFYRLLGKILQLRPANFMECVIKFRRKIMIPRLKKIRVIYIMGRNSQISNRPLASLREKACRNCACTSSIKSNVFGTFSLLFLNSTDACEPKHFWSYCRREIATNKFNK